MIDIERDNLITLEEAAEIAACSEPTIRNWMKHGLETVKIGRLRRTTRRAIQDFIGRPVGNTDSRQAMKALSEEFNINVR